MSFFKRIAQSISLDISPADLAFGPFRAGDTLVSLSFLVGSTGTGIFLTAGFGSFGGSVDDSIQFASSVGFPLGANALSHQLGLIPINIKFDSQHLFLHLRFDVSSPSPGDVGSIWLNVADGPKTSSSKPGKNSKSKIPEITHE
jgi:hypothetical protein